MRSKRELQATLANLSRAGYQVKIRHMRPVEGNDNMMTKGEAKRLGFTLKTKGGYTEGRLIGPDGRTVAETKANVSKKDNFNAERGVMIVVGRLTKQRDRLREGEKKLEDAVDRYYAAGAARVEEGV